jgi:membrane-bound lytic murein transglycosylase MltF
MTATTPAPAVPAGLMTWTGDLPTLMDKRVVRLLVVYSKTFYFIDKGQQRGIAYDLGMQLEKQLNATNKDRSRPIRVMFIPVARNQLLPSLVAAWATLRPAG